MSFRGRSVSVGMASLSNIARNEASRERRRDLVEQDLERLKNELVGFARASPDAALFADWIQIVELARSWVATSR